MKLQLKSVQMIIIIDINCIEQIECYLMLLIFMMEIQLKSSCKTTIIKAVLIRTKINF